MSRPIVLKEENLLGQIVHVEGNRYGTIKFYGETLFAEGLWCGIELNEAVGDNDGIVENIRYFTCKENHGIFAPVSETFIVNTRVSEIFSVKLMSSVANEPYNFNPRAKNELHQKFSVLDSQSTSSLQKNVLDKSYTMSKGYYEEKKNSITTEESAENDDNLDTNKFQSFTNLSKGKTIFSTDQGSKPTSASSGKQMPDQDLERNYDSEESLGVLPDFEGNYDSDESLGILPDFEHWDGVIYDKNEPNRDLNITVNLSHKYMGKDNEYKNIEPEFSGEELIISPICNKPNIPFYAKSDESPIYCTQNMPKCASTPKHESNYSYLIDKDVASTQNITDIPTSVHFESNENINLKQNILNVTCNIFKPLDNDETNLNKTFQKLDVVTDKFILPTIVSDIEPNLFNEMDVPDHNKEELTPEYSHFLPLISSEQCGAAAFDSNVCKKNVLNLTCDLVKEPDASFPQIEVVKDGTLSASPKSSETNVLNATLSYPQELEKTQQICFIGENEPENLNENIVHYKPEGILNTTYEKTDESNKSYIVSETLKCITNLEENRNRTQILQSVGSFGRANVISTELNSPTRRNYLPHSILYSPSSVHVSSEDDTAISTELSTPTQNNYLPRSILYSSSSIHTSPEDSSAKSLLPKCSVDDSENRSHLIKKERLSDVNSDDLIKKTVKCSLLKSKLSESKQEDLKSVSEIELKGSQEPSLNETINFPPLISDIGKTVVKKPRYSMHLPYLKDNSFALCRIPLCKNSETANPSFQKKSSEETASARERSKAKTSTLSSKMVLNKPVALEKRKTISRLPEKSLPQRSSYSGIPSIKTKSSSNIPKPWTTVSARKPPSTRGICKSSTMRKPLTQRSNEFVPKASFNDTILISTERSSKQPSFGSYKPPATRGRGKASLNDTVLISANQNSEEPSAKPVELPSVPQPSQQPAVELPSVPQPSQQQVKRPGRGIPRRIGSSIPKPSKYNLR